MGYRSGTKAQGTGLLLPSRALPLCYLQPLPQQGNRTASHRSYPSRGEGILDIHPDRTAAQRNRADAQTYVSKGETWGTPIGGGLRYGPPATHGFSCLQLLVDLPPLLCARVCGARIVCRIDVLELHRPLTVKDDGCLLVPGKSVVIHVRRHKSETAGGKRFIAR
jgi:hypothetical protein